MANSSTRLALKLPSLRIQHILLIAIAILIGLTPIDNYDIWWHMKTGEWILDNASLPKIDPFSYTAGETLWINHEWLSQILFYLVFRLGNITALVFLKFGFAYIILFSSFRTLKKFTNSPILSLVTTLIIAIAIFDKIMMRPHLISYALIATYFSLLANPPKNRHTWLYLLIPLQILWANLHANCLVGVALVWAFAAGFRKNKHLYIVAILVTLTTLINPYGIGIYTFPFEHLQMESITRFTGEWLPSFDTRLNHIFSIIIFRTTLLIAIFSHLVKKRINPTFLLITILIGILAIKTKRYAPIFIITNTPIIVFNFYASQLIKVDIPDRMRSIGKYVTLAFIFVFIAVLLRTGTPMTIELNQTRRVGLGVMNSSAPEDGIEFIMLNRISGHMFNDMAMGGYLTFRLWPIGPKVFIDGRTPLYGGTFYEKDYLSVFKDPVEFERVVVKYDIDHILLLTRHAWEFRYFQLYLWNSGVWKLVYFSPTSIIYLKDGPKFRDIIERYELKKHPVVEEMKRLQEEGL